MKWRVDNIPLSLAALIITSVFFAFTNTDIWIQDWLFNIEAQRWILDRSDQRFKVIFYDGVLVVFQLFVLTLLLSLLFAHNKPWIRQRRRPLVLVLLSCLLVPGTVALMKATTNMPCPKDLQYYGGIYPFVGLFSSYPESFIAPGRIKCFPAGHASSLFSLLSLYFLFDRKRTAALVTVIVLICSWAIGLYKMMIGDHFLSHTVFTMLWAWLLILVLKRRLLPEHSLIDESISNKTISTATENGHEPSHLHE